MTIQKALNYFTRRKEQLGISDKIQQAETLAISALEKQIPCKLAPKSSKKAEVPVCGKCNRIMDLMQGELNYCPNCGQKIDWSEVEKQQ